MKRLAFAIATIFVLASPAMAVDPTTQLVQLNGDPLVGPDGKPISFMVGEAIKNALLYTDQTTRPDVKNKRFWLAVKVNDAMAAKKDLSFTPEEIVEIKDALNASQSILIAGETIRIIDPTSIPK